MWLTDPMQLVRPIGQAAWDQSTTSMSHGRPSWGPQPSHSHSKSISGPIGSPGSNANGGGAGSSGLGFHHGNQHTRQYSLPFLSQHQQQQPQQQQQQQPGWRVHD